MPTLTLPRSVSGVSTADTAVNSLGSIVGKTVHVDARYCDSASEAFVDRLVERLLGPQGAARAIIHEGAVDFGNAARSAAARHGVYERLAVERV